MSSIIKNSSSVKGVLNLAYPVIISQIGHVLVGVADTVMVGNLGAVPLAAASFANSIFLVALTFGIGVSMAITPLVSAANSQGKLEKIKHLLNHSFFLNICIAFGLMLIVLATTFIFHLMNQPEEVIIAAKPYTWIIASSLLPFMIFQTFRQLAEGLANTQGAMIISIAANLLNVLLNWILIYGKLGLPSLGLNGAGIATFISRVLMGFLMFLFVKNYSRFQKFNFSIQFGKFKKTIISTLLKIGIPVGFQFIFEVGAFSISAIMMGWIGVNALAAHQIVLNLAAITYMVGSGLSAAATIIVSSHYGRKDWEAVRNSGFQVLKIVMSFMSITALVFILMRNILPLLYIQDQAIIDLTAGLMIIAGLFQLSDGIQVVMLGALRGLEDVKIPSIISLIAYWIMGLPLGYILAFKFGLQEQGIWIGLLIGLTGSAIMVWYRFWRLTKSRDKLTI
jgi:MATE family multidrug resistance protein